MGRDQFIQRFVDHMAKQAGFAAFDDGTTVTDYAKDTAPSYWETDWQRELGPEECAEADISYWGES